MGANIISAAFFRIRSFISSRPICCAPLELGFAFALARGLRPTWISAGITITLTAGNKTTNRLSKSNRVAEPPEAP